MKNYLVKSLFRVVNPNWLVHDRSHESDMYDNYLAMHQISVESFQKHLGGEWEMIFISGDVDNINQAFEKTFWTVYELWHREPCNILYTDPDTVAINTVDIWNQFDKFMMFNHTDPRQFNTENTYNRQFENFFNAGVRYFPHTMFESTWELGAAMAQNWDHRTYDTEQIILNSMLWDQGVTLEQVLRPDIAYQAQWLPSANIALQNHWNGIDINHSKIIHVHGSRNSKIKLQLMKHLTGTI